MGHENAPTKQIVVGVGDMTDAADAVALGQVLAQAFGDELRLVHVHHPGRPNASGAPGKPGRLPVLEMLAADSPAAGLQEVLDTADVRLAVLGSSRQGLVGRALAGGVGQRLLSGATCPVVVAPSGYAWDPAIALRAVGCGFDASSEARGAWREACRIAEKTDAAIHVFAIHEHHAFGISAGPLLGSDLATVDDELGQYLHRELMSLVARAPSGVAVESVLADGDPARVLREAGRTLDLLVVGSRGLGSLGSVLLSSVSRKLMDTATCPVMVVPHLSAGTEVEEASETTSAGLRPAAPFSRRAS